MSKSTTVWVAMCKGPLVLKTLNGVASSKRLTTSHEVSTSCSRQREFLAPETLPFRFLLNDWKSTNSSRQTMRSILRIQQGRVPCNPDTDRTTSSTGGRRQRCGTEGLKCLKEHASLDGKDVSWSDLAKCQAHFALWYRGLECLDVHARLGR